MGRCVDPGESVEVYLQVFSKYFTNRVVASYCFGLQRLVAESGIAITDHMTDANNKVIGVSI